MGTPRRRRPGRRLRQRARLRARVEHRLAHAGEVSTAQFLDLVAELFPDRPACPGPVLVHADGSFECHGPACPSGTRAHHPADVVHACQDHPELTPYVACPRCARQPRPLTTRIGRRRALA